jgi:hypothetical protein
MPQTNTLPKSVTWQPSGAWSGSDWAVLALLRTDTANPGTETMVTSAFPATSRRFRWILFVVALVVLPLVTSEPVRVLVGSNSHEVLPGKVYRCAQPSPAALEDAIVKQQIRTVVNLRGCCAGFDWYLDESRVTHRHHVAQEDICLSAGRLPSSAEMRRLADVLEHSEYPLLLHCRRGADRTGLAAAVVLLWHEEIALDAACRQLGLRYGHIELGRPAHLDLFFDLYRDWLKGQGQAHRCDLFRHWLRHEYSAGPFRAGIEWLGSAPSSIARGEPHTLRVRAKNLGVKPWHFRAGSYAGVHIGVHVWDALDRHLLYEKSGLRDAEVLPGGTIDLTLLVPALQTPGRYRLMIDLVDERHGWFYQMGSEPLEAEFVVP